MSFPRKWESRTNRNYWTPAPVPYRVFAGVTNLELLEVPFNLNYLLFSLIKQETYRFCYGVIQIIIRQLFYQRLYAGLLVPTGPLLRT
jgi:hypothetical protein